MLSPAIIDILQNTPKCETILEKMDLAALWQWILCFAVVTFDLEHGHGLILLIVDLEVSYPPIPFSDKEKKTL
jgi:hypothetical protein